MMRIIGIAGCVVLTLLLGACISNPEPLADSGWDFTVSNGRNSLAFGSGWPVERGTWQAYPFEGATPPDLFDGHMPTRIWFDVPLGDGLESLAPDLLVAELAEPSMTAMRVASYALKHRRRCAPGASDDQLEVLRAVAQGRMIVNYEPEEMFSIWEKVVHRGRHEYALFRFGSVISERGWTELCLWPEGFIACWGPSFGNQVAYYYDGATLMAIPKGEVENPVSRREALRKMLANVNEFVAIAGACGFALRDEILKQAKIASSVLSEDEAVWSGPRQWFYVDELLEQLLTGRGLSPPLTRGEAVTSEQIDSAEFDVDDLHVYFGDEAGWEWGIILSNEEWQFTPGAVPSGLVMAYLKRLGEGGSILTCVVSDVPLGGDLPDDVEEAVSAAGKMSKSILASEGSVDKLNAEAAEALRHISERKLTVTSDGLFLTTLSERLRAAGSKMMYTVDVPSNEVALYFHVKRSSATLELVPAFKDVVWRVTLANGELGLVSTQDSASRALTSQVKEAAAAVGRMRDAGLIEVPAFASEMTERFIAAVAASRRYDSVQSVQKGEVLEMEVW